MASATNRSPVPVKVLCWRLAILVGVILLTGLGIFHGSTAGADSQRLKIATTAVLVTGLPACGALILVYRTVGTPQAVSGLLLGILLRTILPLVAVAVLSGIWPDLTKAGLFGKTVIAYLVMLSVETWLAVGIVAAARQTSTASS